MDEKTGLAGTTLEKKSNSEILLVSEYFPPMIFGGGELSAYALAKGLAENELNVSVLTSRFRGLDGFEVRDGFKIYRLMETGDNPGSVISNLKRKLVFPRSEEEALDHFKKRFGVIHCLNNTSIVGCRTDTLAVATVNSYSIFCPKGNLFYREEKTCTGCNLLKFISCILRSEYVAKMKMKFYLRYNPVFWAVTYMDYLRRRGSVRNIRKFIVVNDLFRKLLVEEGVEGKNITKIPNLMTFRGLNRRIRYPLEKGCVNITCIGSLDKIKGVDLLVEAFNRLRGENLRLLIVGDGPERKKLEKMAGAHVRFLGKLSHDLIPSIYEETDIVVLPSRWPEPFSRVLLEATYYGKPVVATDVGGNREGVVDGGNGFLVKPNAAEIEARLKQLLRDQVLRDRMGEESKKIFREKFDKTMSLKKIIDFYELK